MAPRAIFVLALLFMAGVCSLGHASSVRLMCNSEAEHASLIGQTQGTKQAFGLEEFSFVVSPFLREHVACERWIAELQARKDWPSIAQEVDFTPLLDLGERLPPGRLIGGQSALYSFCERSPVCKVRAPYRFGPWFFSGLFDKQQALFGDLLTQCTTLPEEPQRAKIDLEGLRAGRIDDVTDVRFWFTPQTAFADEMAALIDSAPDATFLMTTMTLRGTELLVIQAALTRNPNARVFLLYDLTTTMQSENGQLPEHARMHYVPIFNSPTQPRYYHYKGAVQVAADRVLFTSANLQRYGGLGLFDLGFVATSAKLASGVQTVLAKAAYEVCGHPEYLECTLLARFSAKDHPTSAYLRRTLQSSCSALKQYVAVPAAATPFVYTTDSHEIERIAATLIGSAQHDVSLLSHRFTHPRVMRLLGAARARGIDVSIYAGTRDQQRNVKADLRDVLLLPANEFSLQPHTKGLLIDGRALFWGTGNYTSDGMDEATELFFYTEDAALLRGFQAYVNAARLTSTLGRPISDPQSAVVDGDVFILPSRPAAMAVPNAVVRRCLRQSFGGAFVYPESALEHCPQ